MVANNGNSVSILKSHTIKSNVQNKTIKQTNVAFSTETIKNMNYERQKPLTEM